MSKLSVREIHGLQVLNFDDLLDSDDFAPVKETTNAISFITGMSGWSKESGDPTINNGGTYHCLKLRFLDAVDVDKSIDRKNLVESQQLFLSEILKIYKVVVLSKEDKDDAEENLRQMAAENINKAVSNFNKAAAISFAKRG